MLTLKDRNPSRNLTDDESYGVCLAEVESMCTAPRGSNVSPFLYFVPLFQCQPCKSPNFVVKPFYARQENWLYLFIGELWLLDILLPVSCPQGVGSSAKAGLIL